MPASTRTLLYWPACVVRDCGHRLIHDDETQLADTIRDKRDVWVSDTGLAFCTCHEGSAEQRGLAPFPCDGDALGRFR